MVALFERAGKPIMVIPGGSNLQVMQLRRILRTAAPRHGTLAMDRTDAFRRLEAVVPPVAGWPK
jgi:hypothetical protein